MNSKETRIKTAKAAFISTIPVFSGYIMLGIGFGILLRTHGYSAWWALGMSITMFAGSMQYVAVDLLAGGATLLATAITTLMVNARHLFYGISMVEKYKGAGKKKAYMMFGMTDETYSLVCRDDIPEGVDKYWYWFLITIFDHCYWICGCVLGALLGSLITFSVEGIDFVLTALFVTVFVEQWLSTKDHAAALIGVGCSAVCLVIFGGESFLIPTMLVITAALTVMKFVRGRKSNV